MVYGGQNSNVTLPPAASQGFTITDPTAGEYAGYAVSTGDVNGDGKADIIIGAPQAGSNYQGNTYVVYGGQNSNVTLPPAAGQGFTITDPTAGEQSGSAVSAGDVNGDGKADIIIGAPLAGSNYQGNTYVVYGVAPTPSPSASVTPSVSTSGSVSATPSVSLTASVSESVSVSTSGSGSTTPSLSLTSSLSQSPSLSLTSSVSGSVSFTPSVSASVSLTPSHSATRSNRVTGKPIYPTASKSPQHAKRDAADNFVTVARSQGERAQSWLAVSRWGQAIMSWWSNAQPVSTLPASPVRYTLSDYVADCQQARQRPHTHDEFKVWVQGLHAQGQTDFERDVEGDHDNGYHVSLASLPGEVIAQHCMQRLTSQDEGSQDQGGLTSRTPWVEVIDHTPSQVWRPTVASPLDAMLEG